MTVHTSNSKINVLWSQDERPQSERCLCAGEIERLEGVRPGDAILCTNGVLWVTQEGDPDDHLLVSGDEFVAHHLGLVLVQALGGSACHFYADKITLSLSA
jgi:hypothetical protein